MKKLTAIAGFMSLAAFAVQSQILFSSLTNATYVQNFDTLAKPPYTNYLWVDNKTLPGWYAAHQAGNNAPYYASYRISEGSMRNGWIYSFGTGSSSDRALGSVTSSSSMKIAFGVRFKNDTPDVASKITISYTGEQWRNGGKENPKSLIFSYCVSSTAITNIDVGVDENWKTFEALDFKSPVTGKTAAALDGNAPANRTVFSKVVLPDVTLKPGDELFLRWVNDKDPNNRHGLAVDDFSLSYTPVKKK